MNEIKINKCLIDLNECGYKSPCAMEPKYITIHNTGESASAESTIKWMRRFFSPVSFHYAVDHLEIWQGLEDTRSALHCGDGVKGPGNTTSIGIEICYSADYDTDRFYKATEKAIELTRVLMDKYNISIENVVQHNHWSSEDCPNRIRKEGTWETFLLKCGDKEYDKKD